MYQPMTRTDNPLPALNDKERKEYIQKIYRVYKRAYKTGSMDVKPTLQQAKLMFADMCKELRGHCSWLIY